MSGISGVLDLNSRLNINNIKIMTDIIRHRGPDDEGFYLCGDTEEFAYGKDTIIEAKDSEMISINKLNNNDYFLALGHRMLCVMEIDFIGHQPMEYSDIVITFDGEIYNYLELKIELMNYGYIFETNSDAEVIIKAYKYWGENCVKHFNGIWAFVLWDKSNSKLFCSRDRLGVKPFYYYLDENNFVFGSEIKQIITYGIQPMVNEKILFTFLFYGINDFSEETFFKGILALKGGHNISLTMSADKKTFKFNKYMYWELDKVEDKQFGSFEKESTNIGNALEESIRLRLRGDVEVGSCLSGGLDSSSIVTLACNELANNKCDIKSFKTFTSCYDDAKEADERFYSDLVVENCDCSNIEIRPNIMKIKTDFESLVWHQDEPFESLSIFASWCVMEEVANNKVKVLLDGQGGDETLLGYERFYVYSIKDKIKKLKFLEAVKEFRLSRENSRLSIKMLTLYLVYFNSIIIRKTRLKLKSYKFLNSKFQSKLINADIVDNMIKISNLSESQGVELNQSISNLLRYEDRNSMAYSIQSRVPFLDYEFVQKSFDLPSHYKLREGWTKAPLRKYMEEKMPRDVVYRKNKLGFSVPQERWINELSDYFMDTLLDNPRSERYFNMNSIKMIFKNKTNSDMRFKFIMIETWMRVFNINE